MGRVYAKCYENLKPNGILVVNTKNRVKEGKLYDLTGATRRLEKHGFKFVEKLGLDPEERYTARWLLLADGSLNIKFYRK